MHHKRLLHEQRAVRAGHRRGQEDPARMTGLEDAERNAGVWWQGGNLRVQGCRFLALAAKWLL